MENIHEIDLEKYCNWFFNIANEVETGSMILPYYESRIIRYSMVSYELLLRQIRQGKTQTEVSIKWEKHFENERLRLESEVEKIKDVLLQYSGKIGKALNCVLPNADEKEFILVQRKACFDVDLGNFEKALKSQAVPKEQIIKNFLSTQKYTHLDTYVSGEPLRSMQDDEDLRFKVLAEFAQDLATYDFIKYLNDELLEEQTEEIRISEKSLAYKIMLLHELGFFELNEINKNSSIRAKAEFVHIITGENFDNIRKCLSELDKPKDTKSNNPRKYEDEVKQKIKSLQRF